MDIFFTIGARYLFILSPIIAVLYLSFEPRPLRKRIVAFVFIVFALIDIAWLIASQLYDNPRPFVAEHFVPLVLSDPTNGFPSGHTLFVSAFASIATFFDRRLAIALWVVTIIVAISRVYVGVHHPVDVIGSILISLSVTSAVYFVLRRLRFLS